MKDLIVNNLNSILNNLISKVHTLLDCPERFSGEYGGQKIQHFIEYIQFYKKVKNITDEQALEELGYLLTRHAYTWWRRRKSCFATWSEALTALQNQYAKQRPACLIYKDIFDHTYGEYTTEEDFINDKYELLTELLEPKLTEKNKIDMIFGLLPNDKQSKLDYSTISNLMDLKRQILELKSEQNSTDTKQNGCHDNNSQSEETKEQTNGHEEMARENDQYNIMDIPSTVCTVNDKDPIIKVRRTEDLMPQLKLEESKENILEQQEEFMNTDIITRNHHETETNSFQIDTDIMNQINNIIDESEKNCDSLRDNLPISSIMSVKESPATTIAFLLNGETTIQAEVSSKVHPAVHVIDNKLTRKLRVRCGYCRNHGHKSQACLRRTKNIKLFSEKLLPKVTTTPDDPKKSEEMVILNGSNNSDSLNNIQIDTVTPIQSLDSNVPSLIATINTSTPQQPMAATVLSTLSHNISLLPVTPTYSHIAINSVPSTFSHTTTLTTKLIAPINGPGPNKQLAAKLRNINGPSPKCHQCGTVGFYKSICPNCSPIYNSNQYK